MRGALRGSPGEGLHPTPGQGEGWDRRGGTAGRGGAGRGRHSPQPGGGRARLGPREGQREDGDAGLWGPLHGCCRFEEEQFGGTWV